MILRITNDTGEYDGNTYVLSLEKFKYKEYHPMLASTEWEKVYIDLNENTPRGIIRQVIPYMNIIPVYDKANVTPMIMQLLCEVVPDDATKLRALYMKDRAEFNEYLRKLEEAYWR